MRNDDTGGNDSGRGDRTGPAGHGASSRPLTGWDDLGVILLRATAHASDDGQAIRLEAPWPGGPTVSALGDTPASAMEAFRVELEAVAGRRLPGGSWLAVPGTEAGQEGNPDRPLDRWFVLLPMDRLGVGLNVLDELNHGATEPVPGSG